MEQVTIDGVEWTRRDTSSRNERWVAKSDPETAAGDHYRLVQWHPSRKEWAACPPHLSAENVFGMPDHIFVAEDWKEIATPALTFLYLTYGKNHDQEQ